jgi:glycosyltransferase involved in cell wall biosynthesis
LANQGPVLVVHDLCKLFTEHGHKCTVFYFDEKTELEFPCPVQRIGQREKVDLTQFDVVHSHGIRPDRYVCRHRQRSGRVRYISTVHNYAVPDLSMTYNRIVGVVGANVWMWFLRRHDVVVALSKHAMAYYRRWFPARKLTYAYNTRVLDMSQKLSAEELREVLDFKGGAKLIGMNGGLHFRKRADLMIGALGQLPECKLFLVGDGPSREGLERQAERLGVRDRVHFAGYRPAAYRYLEHYDMAALTSESEGFPLALLEAAAYGKPSVCSDLPILRECFTDEEVSFFELARPETLPAAVRRLMADEGGFGARIKTKFETAYSPEHFYKRYLDIYLSNVR